MQSSAIHRRPGLTLLEMLVVLVILAALAAVVVPLLSGASDEAKLEATKTSLARIREAIVGNGTQPGYFANTGRMPRTMKDLFERPLDETYLSRALQTWDPVAKCGWHGPYLLDPGTRYDWDLDSQLDPAVLDGWGQPIVLQIPTDSPVASENERYARLVSPGPNQQLETPASPHMPAAALRGDDIVLFLRVSDLP